jgi:hypothetical protein
MKKIALIIAFFAFLFSASDTSAQEFNFAKAYQDYIYTQTVYDQAFTGYEQAKNSYLKNPTLTLKEEARKKTLTMLKARDDLYQVYLAALRMKLLEVKSPVQSKMDEEIAWYKSHKENYKDDDPLENLFQKSKEAEDRYESNSSLIIYESLFDISFGEMRNIRADQEGVYASLKNSIDIGVERGILKLDPFNRWFTDIENVLKELDAIDSKAKAKIAKMHDASALTPKSAYNSAINDLTPGIAKLMELNDFLTELLNSINAQLPNP